MAKYEHLHIFRDAYDLTVHFEKIVRNFSRYHKYSLGTDLRTQSRHILDLIVLANNESDGRAARLLELRQALERLKVLARLCQDSGAFASTRSYLNVAERIVNLARQNEGWLKQTQGDTRPRRRARHTDGEQRPEPQPEQLGLGIAPVDQAAAAVAAASIQGMGR